MPHLLTVSLDVLLPKGLLDLAPVDRVDIEEWKLGLAAEGITGEDVGEDGGTIDQMMLQGAVTTSTQGRTAARTGLSSLRC